MISWLALLWLGALDHYCAVANGDLSYNRITSETFKLWLSLVWPIIALDAILEHFLDGYEGL